MSFGEASAPGSGFAVLAVLDCWASETVDSHGQIMARQAIVTINSRIPVSALTARAAGRRSLPPTPPSLPERIDNQGAGILRHAFERLAIERDELVGDQAAPAGRH